MNTEGKKLRKMMRKRGERDDDDIFGSDDEVGLLCMLKLTGRATRIPRLSNRKRARRKRKRPLFLAPPRGLPVHLREDQDLRPGPSPPRAGRICQQGRRRLHHLAVALPCTLKGLQGIFPRPGEIEPGHLRIVLNLPRMARSEDLAQSQPEVPRHHGRTVPDRLVPDPTLLNTDRRPRILLLHLKMPRLLALVHRVTNAKRLRLRERLLTRVRRRNRLASPRRLNRKMWNRSQV